jgi:SAM-dependent MidA family methyltransferase
MRERNTAYYQSSSTSIYEDFSTYAQSPQGLLTRANAKMFHAWTRKNGRNRYDVLEAGVGEGAFALGFLQELRELDKASGSDLASRVHYTLADFSEPMLKKAHARLEQAGFKGQIHSLEWNAGDEDSDPFGFSTYQLVRCNELFCDLPTDAFMQKEGELLSVLFDAQLKPHLVPAQGDELDETARKLLLALPQNYILPINSSALAAIQKLAERVDPKGVFDIFDYGFYQAHDFALPPEIWNDNVVREYNSQWTADVNFLYLSISLAQEGYAPFVQPQEAYVRTQLGEGAKADVRITDGLDYGEQAPEVSEDDFFYHLQVKRK